MNCKVCNKKVDGRTALPCSDCSGPVCREHGVRCLVCGNHVCGPCMDNHDCTARVEAQDPVRRRAG